ncbi:MAG TPA: hypothetical protein VE999_18995 [Gemmataceae bacterium]|nr:hypothetical protein [Gemmataceae bacterium]
MPMEHKAYAFDWSRFEIDLLPLLVKALTTNDTAELDRYIDRHLLELKDPYEGEPLAADWRDMLENRDVHQYGDFALTRYYDPADYWGIGYEWTRLDNELPEPAANAMLGFAIGPKENLFDPGKYGSYFQTPDRVAESLAVLQKVSCPELAGYLELLVRCVAEQRGVYVTF